MTDITELAKRVERIISDVKLKHGGNDTYAPIMKWDEFSALVEALEKAQQVAEGGVDRVRLFLNRGSLVKINGIPVELEHDAVVLVHAGNVPLLTPESVNACETKRDS